MKKDKKEKKPISKKASIIITCCCAGAACIAGAGVGIYYGLKNVNIDYSNINVKDLEDDTGSLYNGFKKTAYTDNYENKYKPHELVNIGIEQLKDSENSYSLVNGNVNAAGVDQAIKSINIHKGNERFSESLSYSSLVKIAKRFYEHDDTSQTEYYDGSIGTFGKTTTYDEGSKITYTLDEYEDTWGKTLRVPIIYTISSKTSLDTSVVTRDGENYIVSLDLNPTLSAIRYSKQMVIMSGLGKTPVFSKINVLVTLDKNLQLLDTVAIEKYTVNKFGMNFDSSGVVEEQFYHEEKDIPTLSESIVYTKKRRKNK